MASIEARIKSASEGPPKRALSASGFRCRFVGGAVDGSLDVVEEFSTDHLRSSLRPGSIMGEEI